VINVQAIDELQFGLFFFMSLESALLSGKLFFQVIGRAVVSVS
jgi:hypothetical protein